MMTLAQCIGSDQHLDADSKAALKRLWQKGGVWSQLADCDELFKEALQEGQQVVQRAVKRALESTGKYFASRLCLSTVDLLH